jgi:flagellin-like hook-associated protein FlgL
MVGDSSYQGINLLKGDDLTLTFNESREHNFVIKGVDMHTMSAGIATRSWETKEDIANSIKEIKEAINKVRKTTEQLGNNLSIIQTRQSFTEALTDILEVGADKLTLADMNETSAEYLMLQTRQQLAVNSLSLASQSASSVLGLF